MSQNASDQRLVTLRRTTPPDSIASPLHRVSDSNDALPSTALAAKSSENTLDLNAVNAHMHTG